MDTKYGVNRKKKTEEFIARERTRRNVSVCDCVKKKPIRIKALESKKLFEII